MAQQAHQHDRQPCSRGQEARKLWTLHYSRGHPLTESRLEKGFYFIALKAGLPIYLYGVDFQRRLIQCNKVVIPSGDVDKDMREIKLYFKDFKGKKPEKFTIGEVD